MGLPNSNDQNSKNFSPEDNEYSIHTANDDQVEETILHYQSLVYQIGLNLTNDPQSAKAVVTDVFKRIHEEGLNLQEISCELKIHRFTYDAALSRLLERIAEKTIESDSFGSEFFGVPKVLQ